MAYTPTDWRAEEFVTANQLNKLEQGITGVMRVLIVHLIDGSDTFDRTYAEIRNAMKNGTIVILLDDKVNSEGSVNMNLINAAGYNGSTYYVYINHIDIYDTSTENGYPTRGLM